MTLTLDIKESALDKVLYLLRHLQDDVTILESSDPHLEIITPNDPDYQLIEEGRARRAQGEKCYTPDEAAKALQ